MNYLPARLRHPLTPVLTEKIADLATDTLTEELTTTDNVNLERMIKAELRRRKRAERK